MEIHFCLKNAFTNNSGSFYAKIYLKQSGNIQDGSCEGGTGSPTEINKQDRSLDIGPWYQPSSTVQSVSFNDVICKWKIPKVTRFDIGIHLYENKNQVLSYADNSALKGHGYLDFHPRESLHIKWPYLNEGESSNGRLFLQTDEDVGGIKLNIGWISFCMSRLSLPEDSSPEVVEVDTAKLFATSHIDGSEITATESEIKRDVGLEIVKETRVKGDFPQLDAVKQILPLYHELLHPQTRDSVKSYTCIEEPVQPIRTGKDETLSESDGRNKESRVASASFVGVDSEKKKFLDSHVITVLDYQTKELDRYRHAISQMGDVIVDLRKDISSLEISNSQLRAQLYYTDDNHQGSSSEDLSMISEANASHNGILKRRLLSTTEEIQQLKTKVQKLQNSLIKKNEDEKDYLNLQKAHELQQSVLQELQAKLAKYRLLEKTCKDQEKIIEVLEKSSSRNECPTSNVLPKSKKVDFMDSLASEKDIMYIPADKSSMVLYRNQPDMPALKRNDGKALDSDIEERLYLLQKLEKTEGRIMALEHQMTDSARQWAREKSQLKLQMADALSERSPYHRQLSSPPLPLLPRHSETYESYFTIPRGKFRSLDLNHRYHHL